MNFVSPNGLADIPPVSRNCLCPVALWSKKTGALLVTGDSQRNGKRSKGGFASSKLTRNHSAGSFPQWLCSSRVSDLAPQVRDPIDMSFFGVLFSLGRLVKRDERNQFPPLLSFYEKLLRGTALSFRNSPCKPTS